MIRKHYSHRFILHLQWLIKGQVEIQITSLNAALISCPTLWSLHYRLPHVHISSSSKTVTLWLLCSSFVSIKKAHNTDSGTFPTARSCNDFFDRNQAAYNRKFSQTRKISSINSSLCHLIGILSWRRISKEIVPVSDAGHIQLHVFLSFIMTAHLTITGVN